MRDYTYLVTMPKSIEPISIRSKRFYRLQLGTPSKQHAKQLCTNLKTDRPRLHGGLTIQLKIFASPPILRDTASRMGWALEGRG